MNQILKALLGTHWAMERIVFEQMSSIILRHASGVRLTTDEITKAIGHDIGQGDDGRGLIVHGSTAIIPIHGVIAKGASSVSDVSEPRGTATGEIQENISRALNDSEFDSIVLVVDSPGGDVNGIEATANLIYKARKHKSIVAFADGTMGSAAYWLASQAQTIFGAETSAVGSIGVFAVIVDSSEARKMAGLTLEVISSGPLKGAVDGKSLTEEQRADIQLQIDDLHAVFVKQVARGRGASPVESRGKEGLGAGQRHRP